MNPITRIHVRRERIFREEFGIFVHVESPRGDIFVPGPVVFSKVEEPETVVPEPTLRFDRDAAVQLMDELWNAGVRPSESGSPGQLAAVQYHLQDMRALVFKTTPKA